MHPKEVQESVCTQNSPHLVVWMCMIGLVLEVCVDGDGYPGVCHGPLDESEEWVGF